MRRILTLSRARRRGGSPHTFSDHTSLRSALALLPLLLSALAAIYLLTAAPLARAKGPHVDVAVFQRDVDPAAVQYLGTVIDTAQQDGSTLLIIEIDTPGGDLDSKEQIVQKELASTVPIATYVAPSGGRAGSAGTFLTLAAPIAAMAPNTRIGAASPIDASGQDIPSTLDRKLKNDLKAQLRGLQTTFGRNAALAEETVETARSFSDQEAIQGNLVNLGATSRVDLLAQLNDFSGRLSDGTFFTLHTAGLPITVLEPTLINQIQTVLYDPTVLFILFIVAALCIYLELAHPGAIVPGTIGAIALVLFLFSAGALNPNWIGLALMLLAILLLAVDVRAPTHGVLTAAGLICLVAGSLIFFDSHTEQGVPGVNPVVVVGFAIGMGLCSLAVISYAIRSKIGPKISGSEGLLGQTATVVESLAPLGRVRVLGEYWAARLTEKAAAKGLAVEPNVLVRIKAVDGLTLLVEPIPM